MAKLTKAQARAWVQQHWSNFIAMSDCPMETCPPEIFAVFSDESLRISRRVFTPAGRQALTKDTPE